MGCSPIQIHLRRLSTLFVTHGSDTKLLNYICGCLGEKKKSVGSNFYLLGQHASKPIHFYYLLGKMPRFCNCKKELLVAKEKNKPKEKQCHDWCSFLNSDLSVA